MSAKSIQVLIGEVVSATNAAIMPTVVSNLNAVLGFAPLVSEINYKFGHEAELTAMIRRYQNDPDFQFKDYPLIWLREDISFGQTGDFQSVTIPSLIIAFGTKGEYMSKDREVQTFEPVLRPIRVEFLRQLYRHKAFRIFDPRSLYSFKTWERKMWGRPEDTKAADVFEGHVDAIEITNLELILNNNCLTLIN